ncbi:Uncharacterized protein YbcI [Durusdinium trenchii]|uniref:Uncharacterized protein YbcI n=1 Tax=Durusdinium trenchii TaxID=1381693 RepID=A0ABP0JLI3_9DINO
MTFNRFILFTLCVVTGCAAPRAQSVQAPQKPTDVAATATLVETHDTSPLPDDDAPDSEIQPVEFENASPLPTPADSSETEDETKPSPVDESPPPEGGALDVPPAPTEDAIPPATNGLSLDGVIGSVYQSYPMLEAAFFSRNIAAGQQLAAAGEFDLKLKAASENGPTGFYQTYRQSIGVVQPLYHGGEAFAGYRIGRGDFEPWYQERQTNGAGEFKAGLAIPLSRNRNVDSRRAAVWRSSVERQLVEPDIQAQLIGFVQEASYAYWDWVAAGARYRIATRILNLAVSRTARIERQVEEGLLDPPELTDNLRLVAERRAKQADAARKLQQTAVKLSLYLRDSQGNPLVPSPDWLRDFPEPALIDADNMSFDAQLALQQRPELAVLTFMQRQLEVDYAAAHNELRPSIDAVVTTSQDMGLPTSKKNDKGQFELDASILVDVPIQRRKARGKMQAIEGKISQLNAKRRFTEDKIVADVQGVYAGLLSAYEQVLQARQAVEYAEELAQRERRNFELGASDLLKVTLREQYAVESANKTVDALLMYYQAQADYRALFAHRLNSAKERRTVPSRRQIEREISQALIAFEKEYMGRGPLDAKTFIIEDMVLVRLKGVLTPAEHKLAEQESEKRGRYLIKQMRQELIEQGRALLDAAIFDILRIPVVSLHTDISTKSGERIIVFTLASTPEFDS